MSFLTYSNRTFIFKDKLSIYKVSEIKRLLLDFYHAEDAKLSVFYLDLSEADSMDTSVFQLLISLKKTIETNKGKLELKKSCQPLDSLMDLLGMSDVFVRSA